MSSDQEAERLWRALRRELSASILEFAGAGDGDGRAIGRLERAWHRICDGDPQLAAAIYHGVEQIYLLMGRRPEPEQELERQWAELAGLAKIGHEANPGARVRTVREIVALGEEEVRRQVDDDTSGAP